MLLAAALAAATVREAITDYASCLQHNVGAMAEDHGDKPGEIATVVEAMCINEWRALDRIYGPGAERMRQRFHLSLISDVVRIRKETGSNPMGWR